MKHTRAWISTLGLGLLYVTMASCCKSVVGCLDLYSHQYFTGLQVYLPCPRGTYSTIIGALSAATCQKCIPGQYATALGASSSVACQSCAAGSFYNDNDVDLSSCVYANEFTWLFKDKNGFYYLNIPNTAVSVWNYYGSPVFTYWNKVRINSTLSQYLGQVQLFVQYLANNEEPCTGDTVDTTFATLSQQASSFADFGTVHDCGFIYASTRLFLGGTPFSIVEQTSGWVATDECNYDSTLYVSCNSLQDCTVGIVGDCGAANFKGLLGVYNVEQYVADIQLACVLDKGDPNLLCSGYEAMCGDPCSTCSIGTYSSGPGATSCQPCCVGTFSETTGTLAVENYQSFPCHPLLNSVICAFPCSACFSRKPYTCQCI